RRREAADPSEGVDIVEPEVQRLAAAHRQAGERALRTIRCGRIARLDERDQIPEQLALERCVRLELHGHRCAAGPAWARAPAAGRARTRAPTARPARTRASGAGTAGEQRRR